MILVVVLMYKKICNRCFQPSYSASNSGQWICPVCQKDLANSKALDANEQNSNNKAKIRNNQNDSVYDFTINIYI